MTPEEQRIANIALGNYEIVELFKPRLEKFMTGLKAATEADGVEELRKLGVIAKARKRLRSTLSKSRTRRRSIQSCDCGWESIAAQSIWLLTSTIVQTLPERELTWRNE